MRPQRSAASRMRRASAFNEVWAWRQVFFCCIGGFDTHSAQAWDQFDKLRNAAQAMAAFQAAVQEMGLGLGPQVSTFTESEFGRSLYPVAAAAAMAGAAITW